MKDAEEKVGQMERKPYSTPALIEYGSIAKLTQTGGNTTGDGGGNMQPCL